MIDFIPAKHLKKKFDVFGHFYSVHLNIGKTIDCRSVLEIISKQTMPSSIGLISDKSPDAIFIMMNPGSSEPLAETKNLIREDDIHQLDVSLVPARTDITQYQLMRVMHWCDWQHARVLNISDLREAKSREFIKSYRTLEITNGFSDHSLFSQKRIIELKRKLNQKSEAPIVCAWGVSSDLNPLIERCLSMTTDMFKLKLGGLMKSGAENKFFHPLPKLQHDKEQWVTDMVAHIRPASSRCG